MESNNITAMSLDKYNQKRDFSSTSEPRGETKKSDGAMIFVVQKHAASRLHYDFRIEAEGVLKSWAVPKGPSLDSTVKRLAMIVEDHPLDYKDFEGNIPEGNYGAGNMIVWDNGTYSSINNESRADFENSIIAGMAKGRISFILNGKKLMGEFSLIKLHGKVENAWLLVKNNDIHSTTEDILKKDKSVISEYSLEDLENKFSGKNTNKIRNIVK
jgi:bifunctional non-homologous end joining protein LigD